MTALTQEQEQAVYNIIAAMALKFCSLPESFPVFQRWALGIDPYAPLQECFREMKPEFLVHMASRLASSVYPERQ
jgi:hypothetical protein